ncbi:MAG: ABC transporter substrate-binding protein [Chloroflexota bacterium]
MYDPLLTFDSKGNVIGAIAESYSLGADGTTWTFKIRKDVKFHDGTPLTSADVAFSVNRFKSEESTNPWSPYLRNNFASMETPDNYTFVYHSAKPEPALVVPFAWTRILPKNYIEKNGTDYFRQHPVGTGPWKFVKFVSKTSFEMEANTAHWRQVPAFKTVIDYNVPEESTRVAMLKNKEVDIARNLSADRIVELQKAGFGLQEAALPTLLTMAFQGSWLTDGPMSDIKVRQALSYSINRQELSDTFYQGLAKPGGRWFMDENTYGWDPSWQPDPYDPDKVKQLLADAGYPGKFANPVINVFTQAPYADVTQALAGYWEDAGIQTKITVVDPNVYGGYFFVRTKDPTAPNVGDIVMWQWPGFFNTIYHAANMYKSTGVHTTGNDPTADQLYAKATAELDPVKAKQYWTEFQNYAYSMWVNSGIVKIPTNVVLGPDVGEFTSFAHLSIYDALAGIQHKK